MKRIVEILKIRVMSLGIVLAGMISAGIFMQSCSNDDDFAENETVNSPELEDFIMTDIELQQSLKTLEKELAKVDFANLETFIENGKKITYLPATIRSLNIEDKIALMNGKKEALFNKYPQLSTLNRHDFANYINRCIKQSIRINEFFLEKKINIYQPVLKSVISEYSFDTVSQLIGHLYNWTFAPDYVEVYIVFFTDGTHLVVLDSLNTTSQSTLTFYGNATAGYYFNGKQISSLAHTHRNSYEPSDTDLASRQNTPNLPRSIYYNGAFHSY
jgi:hypothetical protein